MSLGAGLNRRHRVTAYRILTFIAVLVGWSIVSALVGQTAVPSIPATLHQLIVLFDTGQIYPHLVSTMKLMAVGYVIGMVISTSTGVLLGWRAYLGEVFTPILYVFYAVPKLVFFPVFIAFFGLGYTVQVVFTTVTVALPTFFIIYSAMDTVKDVHIKTAESLQLSTLEVFRKIVVPSIRLSFVTALRLGFSFAILNAVLIQMVIIPEYGFGAVLIQSARLSQVATTLAVFVVLVVISIAGVLGFHLVERLLTQELSRKQDAVSNWTL